MIQHAASRWTEMLVQLFNSHTFYHHLVSLQLPPWVNKKLDDGNQNIWSERMDMYISLSYFNTTQCLIQQNIAKLDDLCHIKGTEMAYIQACECKEGTVWKHQGTWNSNDMAKG
jgi:hypothetical protein